MEKIIETRKKINITSEDNYNKTIGTIKVCAYVYGTTKPTRQLRENIKEINYSTL